MSVLSASRNRPSLVWIAWSTLALALLAAGCASQQTSRVITTAPGTSIGRSSAQVPTLTIMVRADDRAEIGNRTVPVSNMAAALKDLGVPRNTALLVSLPEGYPPERRHAIASQLAGARFSGMAFGTPRKVEVDIESGP